MKRLLFFVVIGLLFIGQASRVEASEGGKSHLQIANEDLQEIDRIGSISDPKVQAQAISDFMRRMQGFGDPVRVEAAKNGLKKFAWNVNGDNWWIIYEKGMCASAYLCVGKPPSDATILDPKGERR